METRSSRSIRPIATGICLTAAVFAAGCNSDPYCQQAISNLRAEKIQLENQYYSLKSQYEAEMRRAGRPISEAGMAPSDFGPVIENVPALPGESSQGTPDPVIIEPTLDPGPVGNGVKSPDPNDSSSYIRSIEVSELAGSGGKPGRLLIQPLDDQGAVIPVEGDLKIELLDANTRAPLANHQYTRQQVRSMVEEDPTRIAGIHVNLPSLNGSESANVLARVRYRNPDGRVFSAETRLSSGSPGSAGYGLAGTRRPGLLEQSDVPPIEGIQIDYGDETSLTSPDNLNSSAPSRPKWGPGR